MAERTLPQLFEESVKTYPANVLLWEKRGPQHQPTTYAGMRDLVDCPEYYVSLLKMVRGKIAEFYRTRLDHLFTPEAKDIVHPQNRTIIGRLGDS